MQRTTIRQVARLGIVATALVLTAGCASTLRIEQLLAEPQRYSGETVQIEGTVTRGAGLLGSGAYQVDDGTGSIYVIAQGQGVPATGSRTKVKGRFESLFNLGGRNVSAIVQPQRREP